MKKLHNIATPRGSVVTSVTVSGKATATLEWNPGFGPDRSVKFNEAQAFVDSEVLRRSEPNVPLRTGQLIKSGQLGTEVGSGEVNYIAPYSAAQYYSKRGVGSATGSARGPAWFQRMKNAHGAEILAAAARMVGGKASK